MEQTLQQKITPEGLTERMMSSEEAWQATSAFATEVLKDLRNEEQKRKKEKEERRAEERRESTSIPNLAVRQD